MFNVNNFYSGTTFLNLGFPLKNIFIIEHDRYRERNTYGCCRSRKAEMENFQKAYKGVLSGEMPIVGQRKWIYDTAISKASDNPTEISGSAVAFQSQCKMELES